MSVRMAGIEGGIECTRLAPLLSSLADGEADAEELALLRPHLKTCLSCRARLREFRAAPGRVAALVPAALVAGGSAGRWGEAIAAVQQKAEALLGATQHKAAALGERAQTAAELVTGQKVAALAASAAALAGGGTAVDQLANHQGPPRPAAAAQTETPPTESTPAPSPSPPPALGQQAITDPGAPPAPDPPPFSAPDPANEFAIRAASIAGAGPAPAAAPPAPAGPAQEAGPARAAPPAPSPSPGAGEFAP
jgi:hypothetical protein